MKVLIIDYGMGNLGSVRRALEVCGATPVVSTDPSDIRQAGHLVLPGVGAFADAMALLAERGWIPAIRTAITNPDVRLLGICLGMQFLADRSFEGHATEGLGLISGEVHRLDPQTCAGRVPHVGWNEVQYRSAHPMFAGIPANSDFYFVHGYHFVPARVDDVLAVTPYGTEIVAAAARGNVLGVQFHPEKSGAAGLQLLRNFLATAPC